MAVLTEIRKRPWLLMGAIAIALLAFLVNPDSLNKVFGKNPGIFGKVNGDEITRDEYNDQLMMMENQAKQQGRPTTGLEEQAWQIMVQSKLIKQQFDKMGLKLTDDMFWSQLQYDPMFAQNKDLFDEKGNFKTQELKKQIADLQASGNAEGLKQWASMKQSIEYRIMARQLFTNITAGITTSKKEAEEMLRLRDGVATADFIKIDYNAFAQKNPVKVTTQDLADYIKLHPLTFKTAASRNLGVVYFPAAPSAADDAVAMAGINKLMSGPENFANTKSDSAFIEANSDRKYQSQYVGLNQLPPALKDKVANAAVGQVVGPFKQDNMYIVSKLEDKKAADSTLSRHILVSYKGNPAGGTETRTQEQAKKLADSIGAVVKADPSKFDQFLKYSDDPSSAKQGGSVGWTTPATPFVPEFLKFLASNGKGATGVVETKFGYHIINIQDKKSGAMSYKIANLVKEIKASDKTTNQVYTNATKFIQQVQGKSFNDFANIAKKNNYTFANPKAVKRFDGQLQGINTDKDADIIAWAFDKKRQKGDTEIFTSEGTGDRIVVYVNGKQDAGTADPESVREQVEPIVRNKMLAKKISEKINSAKITSLDQAAQMFGTQKQTAQVNMLSPQIAGAMEPKVAGAVFGVANNKISAPVEGTTGVYLVQRKALSENKMPGDAKQATEALSKQNAQQFIQSMLKSLQDNADIKDYRNEVYSQTPAQQ